VTGPPKTDAGRRGSAIRPTSEDEVARHLAEFVRADADAFLFTGHLGEGPVGNSNLAAARGGGAGCDRLETFALS